jgi:hypothetical protein
VSPTVVSSAQTRPAPVTYRGLDYEITDYLGGHGYTGDVADASAPQAYIVHLRTPGGVIEPHYHDVDQFQVVVRGDGRIGRHELRVGSVHYVDHHTTYGPIVAGDGGIAYFTLRPSIAAGRYDMPASRARKTVRSGAAFTVQADAASASGPHLLAETVRGARAVAVRLPAGAAVPDPVGGGAAYDLVLTGEVHSDGSVLPADSCVFRRADEGSITGRAGPDGAVLLHLAFPVGAR